MAKKRVKISSFSVRRWCIWIIYRYTHLWCYTKDWLTMHIVNIAIIHWVSLNRLSRCRIVRILTTSVPKASHFTYLLQLGHSLHVSWWSGLISLLSLNIGRFWILHNNHCCLPASSIVHNKDWFSSASNHLPLPREGVLDSIATSSSSTASNWLRSLANHSTMSIDLNNLCVGDATISPHILLSSPANVSDYGSDADATADHA